MNIVYLSLGSNLGNRWENLSKAISVMDVSGLQISKLSDIYETPPWGFSAPTYFLNQVAEARTQLTPDELHQVILQIENSMGRVRSEEAEYVSRIIDIDILFYNDDIINTVDLRIPHPRMAQRRFVLVPLSEIAPGFVHPILKTSIRELLAECQDRGEARLFILPKPVSSNDTMS